MALWWSSSRNCLECTRSSYSSNGPHSSGFECCTVARPLKLRGLAHALCCCVAGLAFPVSPTLKPSLGLVLEVYVLRQLKHSFGEPLARGGALSSLRACRSARKRMDGAMFGAEGRNRLSPPMVDWAGVERALRASTVTEHRRLTSSHVS